MRRCLRCDKPFSVAKESDPKKYCSRSCAVAANNQKAPKRKKNVRQCHLCSQPCAGPRTKFCSRHTRQPAPNLTLADVANMMSAKGKHPSWRWAYVRSMNRIWNQNLPQICQVCGYSRHVELAHIKGIATFPMTALLREVNAPTNVLVLCANHHWEFDNGFLGVQDIPPRLVPPPRIELGLQL